jgi:bacterioferritin-associated ferredoxin
MVEFHKYGMTLHLCGECIDKAKELVDEARKEGGDA